MANSASGMAVNDDCQQRFLELKAKRSYRFIVFKIEEKIQQVTVEKIGMPNDTYDDFAASLPPNECRYAVFDFDFVTDENCQKSKIFFIAWMENSKLVGTPLAVQSRLLATLSPSIDAKKELSLEVDVTNQDCFVYN